MKEKLDIEKSKTEEEEELELLLSEKMENLDTVKEKGGCGD